MPLVVYYFKPAKARQNLRLERLKSRIEVGLGRVLTDREEYLLELSAAILDSDDEQLEQDKAEPETA